MDKYDAILSVPVGLLSNTALAHIYWELYYTGHENMSSGDLKGRITKALKLCKDTIYDNIGDWDVAYDFMESVRQEVVN